MSLHNENEIDLVNLEQERLNNALVEQLETDE